MRSLANPNYKTAIKRGGISAPLKWIESFEGSSLANAGQTRGIRILDYGCGRGEDAEYLGADKYDPYWYPEEPSGVYDIIFCTYVLNVVDRDEQSRILQRLQELVNPQGCVIYVTVRRDVPILEPLIRDGYSQYYVLTGDMRQHGFHSLYLKKKNYEIFTRIEGS